MAHNEPLEVVYFEVQPHASPPLPKYFSSSSSSRAYSSSPRQTSSAVMSFVTGVGSFVIHYAVKKVPRVRCKGQIISTPKSSRDQ